MLNMIAALVFSATPDDCQEEYTIAVSGNAMGWFCARWDCGNREFEATSQMDLYRKVAGDVLAGRVYDLRPWQDMKTVVILADSRQVWAWTKKQFPKIDPEAVFKQVAANEYEWRLSPTSQGVIRSLLKEFPGKVSIGQKQQF